MENTQKKIKKRDINIDLMRTIAALFVVLVHVCGTFVGEGSKTPGSSTFCIASSIQIFTRVAVPLFVLISGRYLLSDWKDESVANFYKKRYPKIIIPFIFSVVIYGFFRILFVKDANISSYIQDAITGKPFAHLWYFYMLLSLYAITPLIYKLRKSISHRAFRNLGFLMLVVAMVTQIGEEMTQFKFPILYFIDYLGFYMTGYSLKDYKPKKAASMLIVYILICALGSGLAIFLQAKGIFLWMAIHIGNNPIATPAAIFLYLFFNNIKVDSSKLADLGKYTLGVYIVHNIFVCSVMPLTNNSLTGIVLIDIILYWLISVVLSFIVVKILWFSKLTRKLVR